MPYPETGFAKMLVVVAAEQGDLAADLAAHLADDKNQLLRQLKRPQVMLDWRKTTNHLPTANREEIAASLETVLEENDHPMMIISGYRDNPDWNAALASFMKTRRLSATFIDAGNGLPPQTVLALFHTHNSVGRVDVDSDETLEHCLRAIKQARHNSALPAGPPGKPLC